MFRNALVLTRPHRLSVSFVCMSRFGGFNVFVKKKKKHPKLSRFGQGRGG